MYYLNNKDNIEISNYKIVKFKYISTKLAYVFHAAQIASTRLFFKFFTAVFLVYSLKWMVYVYLVLRI